LKTKLRARREWLLTAVAVFGFGLTLGLGVWQLSRAHEREALAARQAEADRLPELTLEEALEGRESTGRRVRLQGRWLTGYTVYLDNRQRDGRPGFELVTPLEVPTRNGAVAVLVVRGWAPRDFRDRQALPRIPTPEGDVTVVGRVVPRIPRLYELGSAPSGAIRQNLDIAGFRQETHLPLVDFAVLQTDPAPADGLRRDWPTPAIGAERNYGYAAQWFALSGLIFILYVGFQIVRFRSLRNQD
jgi:surfeit locus 1 family protein